MAETKEQTSAKAPNDPLADRRDESGGLIDPPVIPSFEQRLTDAHNRNDDGDIADITEEYTEAREKRARALVERERKARGDNG